MDHICQQRHQKTHLGCSLWGRRHTSSFEVVRAFAPGVRNQPHADRERPDRLETPPTHAIHGIASLGRSFPQLLAHGPSAFASACP
eukprot:2021133-Amphidinium_carterae.1